MTQTECSRWEFVSAALDGELTGVQLDDAMDHAEQCSECRRLLATAPDPARFTVPTLTGRIADADGLSAREQRWLRARWTRWLLAAAAIVIVAEAAPTYLTGHGHGLDSDAHTHTARHLATWQIGFGVGLLVAAVVSRLTHAMLALALTFAGLTITATAIDVISGHSGPWSESVHLIELVGVVLLWQLTPPHVFPWSRATNNEYLE